MSTSIKNTVSTQPAYTCLCKCGGSEQGCFVGIRQLRELTPHLRQVSRCLAIEALCRWWYNHPLVPTVAPSQRDCWWGVKGGGARWPRQHISVAGKQRVDASSARMGRICLMQLAFPNIFHHAFSEDAATLSLEKLKPARWDPVGGEASSHMP